MDCFEANIVALVKLLGSSLSTREILDLYSQFYQEAKVELARTEKPTKADRPPDAKVEIGTRPW